MLSIPVQAELVSNTPDAKRPKRSQTPWAILLSLIVHAYFLMFFAFNDELPEVIPVITKYQIDLVSKEIGYEQAPVDDVLPPAEPEQEETTAEHGAPLTKENEKLDTPKQEERPVEKVEQPEEQIKEEVVESEPTPIVSQQAAVAEVQPQPKAQPEKVVEEVVETVPEVVKPSMPKYELGSKSNPKPPYPSLATQRGWQGTVVLGVSVNPDGTIKNVIIIESSEYAVFNYAAWETVKQEWRFEPAEYEGQAVEGYIEVPIMFELN